MPRRPSCRLARSCGALAAAPLAAAVFECQSDVDLRANATRLDRKGVNIDDRTMQWCTSQIADVWPNVPGSQLSSIRLFKAWDAAWDPAERVGAWAGLLRYVELEDAKVLLGTPITCNETSDNQAWEWAKELAGLLGPHHIMGLGIGNELELLQFKSKEHVPKGCVDWIFGEAAIEDGYLWSQMTRFVSEFDALGAAYQQVPITSVSTGYALGGGSTFLETSSAPFNSLYIQMQSRWGSRMAFTFNFYPYFNGWRDSDGGCDSALKWGNCFERSCAVPSSVRDARNKIMRLTGDATRLLWIGETGWSSSISETLGTSDITKCSEWASPDSFRHYYKGFLDWDLGFTPDQCYYHVQLADTSAGESGCADTSLSWTEYVDDIGECRAKCNQKGASHISWHADKRCECYSSCEQTRPASEFEAGAVFYGCGGDVPVDHAFFFSLRDSQVFGKTEAFGLVDSCDAPVCKVVASPSFRTHDYQAFGNASERCSGPALFDGWSYGAENCQNKCSVDSRCAFFTRGPYSHTDDDGQDLHWCRLTASCCDTETTGIESRIYAKRVVDYDPSSSVDCDSTQTDAAFSVRGSPLLAGVVFLFSVFWCS